MLQLYYRTYNVHELYFVALCALLVTSSLLLGSPAPPAASRREVHSPIPDKVIAANTPTKPRSDVRFSMYTLEL